MMPLFLYDIGEKERAVSRFIGHVRSELQRAFAKEKSARKLTQQAVAQKLDINRSVINRQLIGYDNMTLKSVAELAWAIGWVPDFCLREPEQTTGNFFITNDQPVVSQRRTQTGTANTTTVVAAE